jgi:hypothetical protein
VNKEKIGILAIKNATTKISARIALDFLLKAMGSENSLKR